MRRFPSLPLACAAILAAAWPAHAQIESAYTDLDIEKHCTTFASSGEDEGHWANMVCDGYRGYPLFLQYGDERESIFYGHTPGGALAPAWESFAAFNHAGPRIEWRIERRGGNAVPFATIHRWFVSDDSHGDRPVEVLVVEKVGQPYEREGCAVAYVVSTGNADANEKARGFADRMAADFACGADQPAIDSGTVPLPDFVNE